MGYEIFEKLCKINNVKPSNVSKETGIATATLTSWKKGQYTPKREKLKLIADYFDVTVEYLMTGNEPELSKYSAKNAELLNRILDDIDLKDALEKYFELSDVKKKLIIDTINILWD